MTGGTGDRGRRTSTPSRRRLDFRAEPWAPDLLDEVVGHLRSGGLIAYPTETVYGFGCLLRTDALEALARLKEREADRPFLLLVPDEDAVADLRWTDDARELASVFWPGAMTLVLADPDGRYPEQVRGPTGGVGVRRSSHNLARAIVEAADEPLTSTSANRPGEPPALSAASAEAAAAAFEGASLWILDGGGLPESPPSTVVDLTGSGPVVLREGAVPASRLACVKAGPS